MDTIKDLINEWKEAGTIKYVRWNTVNDEFVCKICKLRAGKEFLLEEIESLYPGCDDCRCWISPIVEIDLFEQQIDEILSGKDEDH